MNTELIAFFLISVVTLAGAMGVVLAANPINSALSLLSTLFGVAALFALLGAHFLAMAQIVVYAGAILVLVLFVLMLLNVKVEARTIGQIVSVGCAALAGVGLLVLVVPGLLSMFSGFRAGDVGRIGAVTAVSEGTVRNIGLLLYTKYVFTFEVASVLLLVGIVGAVMVARRVPGTVPGSGAARSDIRRG